MTINANKIHLGAADSMILQFGSTTYDLGASMGGCTFDFNATVLQIEIDQSLMPLQAFRTKEEIAFTTTMLQVQMNLVNLAFGYAGSANGVTTTASGSLSTPAAPTVTPTGGAAASYSYKVIAWNSNGDSEPSTAGTTTTGPTTLTPTAYNTITHAGGGTGVIGYKIERSSGGTSQGIIATFYTNAAISFQDTGGAATAYTESATNPAYPNTDAISVGGSWGIPSGVFYASMPKLDGTNNHIRLTMNKVVSWKAIKMDFARDKVTGLAGFSLLGLADTTKPIGQQGFSLVDEY